MKRMLIVLCIVGLLVAIPLSHSTFAAKGGNAPPRVPICHVTASAVRDVGSTIVIGRVISVPENVRNIHVAHGDVAEINDIDGHKIQEILTYRQIAEKNGLHTAGANCAAILEVPK